MNGEQYELDQAWNPFLGAPSFFAKCNCYHKVQSPSITKFIIVEEKFINLT